MDVLRANERVGGRLSVLTVTFALSSFVAWEQRPVPASPVQALFPTLEILNDDRFGLISHIPWWDTPSPQSQKATNRIGPHFLPFFPISIHYRKLEYCAFREAKSTTQLYFTELPGRFSLECIGQLTWREDRDRAGIVAGGFRHDLLL